MQRTGDAAKSIKVGERRRLTSLSESYAPQLGNRLVIGRNQMVTDTIAAETSTIAIEIG
jgi:hypothetical protein